MSPYSKEKILAAHIAPTTKCDKLSIENIKQKKSSIFIKSEKLMIKITKYDLFSSLYCKTVLFLKSQSLKIVIEYIKDINKRI